jgi:arylsulfatase A-like enzyme
LLYVADTLRADDLACYGNPLIETPHVDRLAAEGSLFENAYAQSSWTRTSMASLLTSTYPAVHGVEGRMEALAEEMRVLPEMLSEAGYTTAAITGNPNIGSAFGFRQGFDEFFELYERRDAGRVRVGEFVTTADRVSEVAIEWIDRASEPFFLLVLSIDPHSPYEPPPEFDRFGGDYQGSASGKPEFINRLDLSRQDKQRIRALHYGEVAFNDHAFGKLVDDLEARGLYDRTAVIFVSDHGEEFWEHGGRGHGKTLFEEVVHVPLILRLPGRVAAGERVARPVELVDVVPTVLEFSDLPIPADIQGISLLALPAAQRLIQSRLVLDGTEINAVRLGPNKLIEEARGSSKLFDLGRDPGEKESVSEGFGEQRRALERMLVKSRQDNEILRVRLRGSSAPVSVRPDDLSPEVVRELERLGYIETEKDGG